MKSLLTILPLLFTPSLQLAQGGALPTSPASTGLARAQDLEKLAEGLDSQKPRVRHGAVDALADLGTADAWAVVLDRGITDLNSRVADSAQLRLAAAPLTPDLLDLLESRSGLGSRKPICRIRVAQALGSMPGTVPAQLLERGLKDKEPGGRAGLATAIEQRSNAGRDSIGGRPADLKRLLKGLDRVAVRDRDPRTRAAGLLALHAFARAYGIGEQEADDAVADALRDPEFTLIARETVKDALRDRDVHRAALEGAADSDSDDGGRVALRQAVCVHARSCRRDRSWPK